MRILYLFLFGLRAAMSMPSEPRDVTIQNDNPLIYYHGRWDSSPGTWWEGSGFKMNVENLTSLALNLGPHTTTPNAAIGVSFDDSEFSTVNVTAGLNAIPIPSNEGQSLSSRSSKNETLVRINVEGWQNNRINLLNITLNEGANLLPYVPSKLAFQFIGDSLSAGQYLEKGVDQAWTFLTGEHFKAEHRIQAQPGACLTDIESYGNAHGVSYQFFHTEDNGYVFSTDHNFTTPWDFNRDVPAPTHVVIHIGANDASQNVTNDEFVEVYTDFVARLRELYPTQPFFIFTPWGWPSPDGSISYYFEGQYQKVVDIRSSMGDDNLFIVNATGWITFDDVFPDNIHPNEAGHAKIAGLFENWLESWGINNSSNTKQ